MKLKVEREIDGRGMLRLDLTNVPNVTFQLDAKKIGPFFFLIREVYQGEDWARNTYDPCLQDFEYYDKERYCAIASRDRPYSVEDDDER